MNSPVSGQPPYFSLTSLAFAYENYSRERTALLTDTFSRGCPPTRELTIPLFEVVGSAKIFLSSPLPLGELDVQVNLKLKSYNHHA